MLKHGSHLEQERITEPSPNQINTQVAVFLTNIHLKQDFARLAIQDLVAEQLIEQSFCDPAGQ